MQAWNSLDVKTRLALIGLSILIAKDVLSYGRARAQARLEGKPVPPFEWWVALPTWWLGLAGGFGVGTGIESFGG